MSENNFDFNQFDPDSCPIFENFTGEESVGETVKKLAFYMNILQGLITPEVAGVVKPFIGKSLPIGYVWADGSHYRAPKMNNQGDITESGTYDILFDSIGFCHGKKVLDSGDVCFRVPDMRGASVIGMDRNANCIRNISEYSGFNSNGSEVFGDVVGAKNISCSENSDITNSCTTVDKKILVNWIISTGQICF